MVKDLEKMLMSKKDKGAMSEKSMQAKMEVLQELLQMAQEAMGSKVKGGMDEMQKVSVMAPDQEGLKKGLEIAEEIAENSEEMPEEASEPKMEEASEEKPMISASEESDEDDDSLFGKKITKKRTTSNMMYDE